jgi:acetolactate synthase-1/2/3 large subunit
MPITRQLYRKDINQLYDFCAPGLYIANSGRPGPVLVDIRRISRHRRQLCKKRPLCPPPDLTPRPEQIKAAAVMLGASKNPLIYAGGGIISADASCELMAFADLIHAPVSLSIMGLTALPASYPRTLGMRGMHGTPVSTRGAAA